MYEPSWNIILTVRRLKGTEPCERARHRAGSDWCWVVASSLIVVREARERDISLKGRAGHGNGKLVDDRTET